MVQNRPMLNDLAIGKPSIVQDWAIHAVSGTDAQVDTTRTRRRVRAVKTCALVPDAAWIAQPCTIGGLPIATSVNIGHSAPLAAFNLERPQSYVPHRYKYTGTKIGLVSEVGG